MAEFDDDSIRRISQAVQYYERSQRLATITTPHSPQRIPLVRGWLLNSTDSPSGFVTVLAGDYNPSMVTYQITQVGLWGLTDNVPWALRIGNLSRTFTDPTVQELVDFFSPIGLRAFGGNPVRRSSPGVLTTDGKVDHRFWLVSYPRNTGPLAFTPSASDSYTGKAVVGRFCRDTPSGTFFTAFDALDLDYPIRAGSKVICQQFNEGLGITGAIPSMVL
jgi:hypothetical protein